jgi:hypothetical protein
VTASTLADVIDLLFTTIRRPNGSEHSMEEAAKACTEWLADRGGGTLSKQYLRLLRSGDKDNPSIKQMEALAVFFDVDPAIWSLHSERSRKIQKDLVLARKLIDSFSGAGLQAIAMRHGVLADIDRDAIVEFIGNLPSNDDTAQ